MKGRLFICATPIGNLEDSSPRLLRTLREADLVAAEDTRRTRKLLTHFGIHARCVSYRDENERQQTRFLIDRLRAGATVALVSDGGMPGISDPGYRLIAACIDEGIEMTVVPGPSAVLAALVLSGLPTHRFAFEGFLPSKAGERKRRLEALVGEQRTLIFFESPKRVADSVSDMARVFGERKAVIARELTKMHEEIVRSSLHELALRLQEAEPVGEVVLVVEGAPESSGDLETAVSFARQLVQGGTPKTKAAAEAASKSGVAKRDVYRRLVEWEAEPGREESEEG